MMIMVQGVTMMTVMMMMMMMLDLSIRSVSHGSRIEELVTMEA